MTRWHLDDLAGRLEAVGGWDRMNLMAIAEAGDPLLRKPGEALFPELKSAEFVEQQMAGLTRYWSSALYRGQPVPRGGHLLDPSCLRVIQPHEVPQGLAWVRSWDPAAVDVKTSKSGDPDFTAGAKCAIKDGCLYVADMAKWQLGWPKSRDRIRDIAVSERVPVYFEAQAAFKAAADNLREVMPENISVRTVDVSKDKVSRCNEWFALAEHGKVFLVAGAWVPSFLMSVEQFDGSGSYHDDDIDAVSIGYEACSHYTSGEWRPVSASRSRSVDFAGRRALVW
jgi:predicted phage terminase large subunit-like protein